jgi:hypothetical protein
MDEAALIRRLHVRNEVGTSACCNFLFCASYSVLLILCFLFYASYSGLSGFGPGIIFDFSGHFVIPGPFWSPISKAICSTTHNLRARVVSGSQMRFLETLSLTYSPRSSCD